MAERMDRVVQLEIALRAAQRLAFDSLIEALVLLEDWGLDYCRRSRESPRSCSLKFPTL